MRGRNKLVPRLLGITRESIMRVDENTKEVLKTWPLTTVRRWAASPNSFTLVGGSEGGVGVRGGGEEGGRGHVMLVAYLMRAVFPLHTNTSLHPPSSPPSLPGLWRLLRVLLLGADYGG